MKKQKNLTHIHEKNQYKKVTKMLYPVDKEFKYPIIN